MDDRKVETDTKQGSNLSVSLRLVLTAAIAGLVILAVGSVLFITVRASFENTFSLLNERAIRLLDGMTHEIQKQSERAQEAASAVADLYGNGAFSVGESDRIDPILRTILLSDSVVDGMLIVGGDRAPIHYWRMEDGTIVDSPDDVLKNTRLDKMMPGDNGEEEEGPYWAPPQQIGASRFQTVSMPLKRDGQVQGHVIAAIGQQSINRVIAELGRDNRATVFVLGTGNRVIAHSHFPDIFKKEQEIPLKEFPDPILAQFATASPIEEFADAAEQGVEVLESGGRDGSIFIVRELPGFQRPYLLGAYFSKADMGEELFRLIFALIAGLIGLLAAAIVAILLGSALSKPMRAVANRAAQLADLDIENLVPLPHSRIAEIDRQSQALNRLRLAMQEFGRYVPRALVLRLLRSGAEATRAVEREITILFTDLAGFTRLSERMNAADTAATLNSHFDLLCREIEGSGGTVDKFLGDGVMAFWGAPEAEPDHAARAVSTAARILDAVSAENEERRMQNLPPLRVRIGIHTGRAIVGNIGGGSRQNYTIVGDAVNLAQRLEQLGKELIEPDADGIVVVSSDAAKAAGNTGRFRPAGTHVLRGREKPVAVLVLETGPGTASANVVRFPGTGSA
jgi:adenylate cyclase